MKILYEQVMIEGDKILFGIKPSASIEEVIFNWNDYINFINACGWTNQELDEEILKRVDKNWD